MKTYVLWLLIAAAGLLIVADSAQDSHPGHVLQRRAARWLLPRLLREPPPSFQSDTPVEPLAAIGPRQKIEHERGW